MDRKISISALLLLLCSYCLLNAEYGVITGRVTDDETGKPLIGADVWIQGTELGAASDQHGEYAILWIPLGMYNICITYIGYEDVIYDSVQINADDTVHLNFQLVLNKIIIPDMGDPQPHLYIPYLQTQNSSYLFVPGSCHPGNRTDYDCLAHSPIINLEDLLLLQNSMTKSDSGLHLRCGRHNEIIYFLDNMEMRVPNLGIQPVLVCLSAIDKIALIRGGLNAEYGNALSGVINIHTKEGGTKHSGTARFLTDEVFGSGNEKLNFGYNLYDFSLGGPIPVSNRLRYFISGELMMTDAYQDALYKIESPRMDYRGQARFSYLFPNARGNVTFSGFTSREQYIYWQPAGMDTMTDLVYVYDRPMQRSKTWIISANFGYILNAKTFLNTTIGLTHFDRVYGSRDREWEAEHDQKWFNDYRLKNEDLIDLLLSDTEPWLDILVDSIDFTEPDHKSFRKDPYGIRGLFTYIEDFPHWSCWQNNDIQIRGDITRCLGKHHEIKTGFDIVKYDMRYYNRQAPPLSKILYDFRYYHKNPYKLAGFLQDKIDLQGIVMNLGMRFDLFDANTETFYPEFYYWYDSTIASETITTLSPRIGFSLPVSGKTRFRFAYGHYYQIPAFDYLYNTSDVSSLRLLLENGVNVLSNISLKPEKLIVYEIGFERIYKKTIFFSIDAYYKDYSDLLQLRRVQAIPDPYYQYYNDGNSTVKGIELLIRKQLGETIEFGIKYSLQYGQGISTWAHKDYYTLDTVLPAVTYWLDHDERHNIKANFDLSIPRDFSFSLFRNLASSLVFSYHSGHPFTLEDLAGNRLENVNSSRMPDYFNVDWKISRYVNIGKTKFELTCLINNLFNIEQILKVYPTTGRADEYGYFLPSVDQFSPVSVTSSYYSPQADQDHDGLITPVEFQYAYVQALNDHYNDPTFYNNGFRMRLGIGIKF
jgi:hypothetical protein